MIDYLRLRWLLGKRVRPPFYAERGGCGRDEGCVCASASPECRNFRWPLPRCLVSAVLQSLVKGHIDLVCSLILVGFYLEGISSGW
ncbi:MAG: hypothetical protein EBS01_15935 [Verrucomicrobia bacterium]|nr:hypothetical protein [Verrucomicrobiota bacterium]